MIKIILFSFYIGLLIDFKLSKDINNIFFSVYELARNPQNHFKNKRLFSINKTNRYS